MKKSLPILAFLIALTAPLAWAEALQSEPTRADVVVYGSTPGGFCAAAAGIAVAQRMRPRAIRIMGSRLPTVSRSRPFSTRSR